MSNLEILDGNIELKQVQQQNNLLKNILTIELIIVDLILLGILLFK